MPKVTLMVGLPASGKSTRAAQILKETGNTFRVNRDELRAMLFPGFKWSGRREDVTIRVEKAAVREILKAGYSAVVDDTNLNTPTREGWKALTAELGAEYATESMGTTPTDCIRQDNGRFSHGERAVGPSVIWNMALRAKLIKWEKPIVIVDLDGTLADTGGRIHFIQQKPKDWHGFHKAGADAKVRWPVAEWVRSLQPEYEPVIVSGRDEAYQWTTASWIYFNVCFLEPPMLKFFMRRGGDHRDDTEVKADILHHLRLSGATIAFAIDDRKRICDLWRSSGIKTYMVGDDNGQEF